MVRFNDQNEQDKGYPLFINELKNDFSEKHLEKTLKRFGEVKEFWFTRNPPFQAFVVFQHKSDAENAFKNLNGKIKLDTACLANTNENIMCRKCRDFGHKARDCNNKTCFKCGDLGHFAKSCPNVNCFRCGERGHVARKCHLNVIRNQKRLSNTRSGSCSEPHSNHSVLPILKDNNKQCEPPSKRQRTDKNDTENEVKIENELAQQLLNDNPIQNVFNQVKEITKLVLQNNFEVPNSSDENNNTIYDKLLKNISIKQEPKPVNVECQIPNLLDITTKPSCLLNFKIPNLALVKSEPN